VLVGVKSHSPPAELLESPILDDLRLLLVHPPGGGDICVDGNHVLQVYEAAGDVIACPLENSSEIPAIAEGPCEPVEAPRVG
jgi:hypothetical protein